MNTAGIQNLVFIALIIGVFYFLVIRPQQKRTAAQRAMLSALKPGDEIVTIGGIFGEVVEVGERVRIRVADGSEFELAKQAVGQVVSGKSETAEATEAEQGTDEDEQVEPPTE